MSYTGASVGLSDSAKVVPGLDSKLDIAFTCCSDILSYGCNLSLLRCLDHYISSFSGTAAD